ncbi:DUF5000 domain-containing lipoprotein [Mucilaginibacter gynuensis]|uniref:DUF5000 domain-containing lipoprotein n=1 Tax=Mucilaginibacter gynuensis TaxID=1302236 RepID=A0ABP8G1K9_9SPHI
MKPIKYLVPLYLLIMGMLLAACTKEDAYKSFEKGGEITYPGRADSVIVQPGYKKLRLAVVLGNDPLVTKIKVYWNDGQDSTELAVTRTTGKDTANIDISDLSEGNYNFNIYTFDKENHRSVVVNVAGIVYGDSYLTSLENRTLKSVGFSADGKAQLLWGDAAGGEVGIELKYFDSNGAAKTIIIPPSETDTRLSDYKDESSLTYRSLFKPDSLAFETFSPPVAVTKLPFFERMLDKSKFVAMLLPGDVDEGGYGWLLPYLWDERYSTPGFASKSTKPVPFTFDTGVTTKLSRFKMWQANDRLYNLESAKTFEVYGSNNPNPNGSWDSWTKLLDCESIKPSGLPLGQNSAADVAYALAGEEFKFPANIGKYRYLRFKLLTNWGNGSFMTMEELTFYTQDH